MSANGIDDPAPGAALPRDPAAAAGRVELREHATTAFEAIRLTELGARAGLVCQVTGLEKAVASRLYRQVHGVPSPSGLQPFTDAWFLKNDRRMLHASLVWRLSGAFARDAAGAAQSLIDVYECYRCIVIEPALDITRAALVPRLVAMGTWEERRCTSCTSPYLSPLDIHQATCPGCRLYRRHRCRGGGTQQRTSSGGSPRGDREASRSNREQ